MIKHFLSSDGLQLAYQDEGEGFPVTCLAGLTRNSADFDNLVGRFPDMRFIRPDARGRGESAWDPDPANYNLMTETRDVLALLDHLAIQSTCFIGTSRGGLVTMVLASLDISRVAGFVFNDIGPRVEQAGLDQIAGSIGNSPDFSDVDECARHLAANSPGFANVTHEQWVREARRRYRQSEAGLVINYDPGLRESFLAATTNGLAEIWELFAPLVNRPGAVIRGSNSTLLSAATIRKMTEQKPDLLAVEIPDRGHCPFLDEPAALTAIATILNQLA